MGDAHLARPLDPRAGLPPLVVVKRMHAELGLRSEYVQRFRHEAELATHVESPHVAAVYDAGQVGHTLYIAMEYVRGWPLSRVMASLEDRGATMSVASAVDVVCDALRGLGALHDARDASGRHLAAVHRDVSPKNLMVGEDGRTRVIDLGIGKSTRQDWKTRTGAIIGTPGYLAPEQAGGVGAIDHRADLFAIGVVLWELLSGEPYIARDSVVRMLLATVTTRYRPLASRRPDVPEGLDRVLARALSIDPVGRHDSAAELLNELRAAAPRAPKRASAVTIVGEMAWSELDAIRTEVAALEATPLPEQEPTEPLEPTEIFARRRALEAGATHAASVEAQPRSEAPPRARERARVTPMVAASGAVLVAAIVLATSLVAPGGPQPARVVRPAPSEVRATARPAIAEPSTPVAVRRREEARAVAPLDELDRSGRPTGTGAKARARATERASAQETTRPNVRDTPLDATSDTPREERPVRGPATAPLAEPGAATSRADSLAHVDGESGRAWLDRLVTHARALRDTSPAGSPRRDDVDRILVELLRLRASRRLERELGVIEGLARELGRIE